MSLLPHRFASKSSAVQLVIFALVLDLIGFVGSYLLGPSLGVDPLVGGVLSLVATNVPMSLFVMQRSV